MNSFPHYVSFGPDEQPGGDEAEDGSAALPHQPQALRLRQEGKSRLVNQDLEPVLRIRILLSSSKNSKQNIDSYRFVTSS